MDDLTATQRTALIDWANREAPRIGGMTAPPPAAVAGLSAKADALAARLADGRACALITTEIGNKGNFRGILVCSAPLHTDEMHKDASGRAYISVPEVFELEELYLSGPAIDGVYPVFFDLN